MNNKINRREFLIGGAVSSAVLIAGAATLPEGTVAASGRVIRGAMPWREGVADAPVKAEGVDFRFFSAAEQAFIMPAIDRLIPPDDAGPSASQADVHIFLDRQLAGDFGRGDHYYLGGPWPKGTPEQGYQTRLTPAQFYRTAIPAVEAYVHSANGGKNFKQLTAEEQDHVLKAMENGEATLEGSDAKGFFTMFLQNVLEGYFSDPIYGGNKDMAAWKMIGFPGAHYDYREWIDRHGERVPYPPVSLMGRPGWSQG